jgi:hypothetical protein
VGPPRALGCCRGTNEVDAEKKEASDGAAWQAGEVSMSTK